MADEYESKRETGAKRDPGSERPVGLGVSRTPRVGSERGFRDLGTLLAAIAGGLILYALVKSPGSSPPVQPTSPQASQAAIPPLPIPPQSLPPAVGAPPPPKIETVQTKPTEVPKHVQSEAAKLDQRPGEKLATSPQTQPLPNAAAPTSQRPTFEVRVESKATQPTAAPELSRAPQAAQGPQTQSGTQVPPVPQAKPTPPGQTASMKIQHIKSASGIEAWLVEEKSVPLLALRFAFEGGNAQDPAGKEGIANFLTAMMDEGAGDLDHAKFQERAEELAFKMAFEDGRDSLYGSFETLSANRQPSLDMLRLALNKPRFDADAVERIKKQLLAGLAFAAKSPDKVASKTWNATAFAGHPYGRPAEGTPESITSITRDDLEAYRRRVFARDTLKVVAVGDITAKELGGLLDHVFGELPAKAELVKVAMAKPAATEKLKVIEMDVPQSVVQFGMNGVARKDPDFIPAFVLNQILGGGGFASRLTEEVREKRGLAYSVYSYLQPYRHVSVFGGGVATKNEEVGQSLDVIRAELKRMADDGPTPTELANAQSYLTGSFALRFDTNAKIANQLLWMLQEDMGIDYVEKRNATIEAVTLDDLKRAAKRLLAVDDLIITVVGKPKGLAPRG